MEINKIQINKKKGRVVTIQEKSYKHIGSSVPRLEGPSKVTGQARFTADIPVPGLLYARLVTSPYAHARILKIESQTALALPGVVRVVTAADLPLAVDPTASRKRKPLADREVLFAGQPVAVVLGESEAAATDGAALVQVTYEALPVAATTQAALAPGAPLVRKPEELSGPGGHGGPVSSPAQNLPPNVSSRSELKKGDIEQAFAGAAVIVEDTFHLPMVYQGYLEPMACTAVPDGAGNLTVYASTQTMFDTRREVAQALGISVSRVKVVLPYIGGGFGAKAVLLEPLCAGLAWLTGRPVHLSFSRMEDLAAGNPMPDCTIKLKLGAASDGALTALQARIIFDTGAYPGSPMGFVVFLLSLAYPVPNYEIEGIEVVTHRVGGGSYRAPGLPQMTFALESQMDMLAHALKIDPLIMRRRNFYPGNLSAEAVMEQLENSNLWQKRLEKRPNEGWGLAFSGSANAIGPASASCRLNEDGTFSIITGLADLTGSSTGLALIAAEVLATGLGNITMTLADSDSAPYTGATGGSRSTYTLGAAVQRAAQDARAQILAIAADRLEANPDDLELLDGSVRVKGAPTHSLSLQEISDLSGGYEGRYEPVLGRGKTANTDIAVGNYVHLAHVRVDPETGDVAVLDYLAIHDVGCAIQPEEVAAQMHGGVTQGLGWALYEQMVYDAEGALVSGSLMDYALQTAPAVPVIQTIIVGIPSSEGPNGAKGIGEPPIVPPAAAISNAIYDATGIHITELPATPERVFRRLNELK
jgi:CO/xanthine dehydrogenase Mo-binding subunit